MNEPARGIPLRPDLAAAERQQRKSLIRAITSIAVADHTDRTKTPEKIVTAAWPRDQVAEMLTKAALAGPMTLESSGLEPVVAVNVLASLAPASAAVRLFSRCMQVSLDHVNEVSIPRGVSSTPPIFIGEGMPAPVVQCLFPHSTIGPAKKILILAAVTSELENAAPQTASDIVGKILADATQRSLDSAVFDATEGDAVRPSGLLFGLSPLTASAATGLAAISEDLGNLAGAISDVGVDGDDLIIVANPKQAIRLKLLAGPSFDYTVLSSSQIPDGRVIAIAASAVASGYSGIPSVEKRTNPAIHFEDTSPQNIATVGTPAAIVAAPTLSAFQSDMIALRVRTRVAWTAVAPGIAFVNDVTW
jgi:hypothetical protein